MINIIGFASSSSGNLFVVQNEDTNILLEAGLQKKDIMRCISSVDLMIIDFSACIISHAHT